MTLPQQYEIREDNYITIFFLRKVQLQKKRKIVIKIDLALLKTNVKLITKNKIKQIHILTRMLNF